MTTISRSSLVLFTPEQMFNLVNDIEHYPSFLPWCRNSKIISTENNIVNASLDLAKGGIHQQFSTQNTLNPYQSIAIELIDGPFQYLRGNWQFAMIGDQQGCRVQLDLEFEFSNKIISMALGPIFSQISASLVEAFCHRAQEIYGNH